MAWDRGTGKENHKTVFENVSHDRCIFCGGDRTEIARTDFTIMFSEFEYTTGSICKSCYHANAKQVKAIQILGTRPKGPKAMRPKGITINDRPNIFFKFCIINIHNRILVKFSQKYYRSRHQGPRNTDQGFRCLSLSSKNFSSSVSASLSSNSSTSAFFKSS